MVLHIEPAPDRGVAVEGDDIVANQFAVIPHRHLLLATDAWGGSSLFAEIESFAIGDKQIAFDE